MPLENRELKNSLNIKFYDNFIQDLTGRDFYNRERHIHSIVGFYAMQISNDLHENKNNGNDDNYYWEVDGNCEIKNLVKAEFIDLDGIKRNRLLTSAYIDSGDGWGNIRKISYIYEVLGDGEQPYVDSEGNIGLSYKFLMDMFFNGQCGKTGAKSINGMMQDPDLSKRFRIAFDIYSNVQPLTNNVNDKADIKQDSVIENETALSSISNKESFRPVIDIHQLRVMVNLISVTSNKNQLFHTHQINELGTLTQSYKLANYQEDKLDDLGNVIVDDNGEPIRQDITIDRQVANMVISNSVLNDDEYKNCAVTTLFEFANPNDKFNINQTGVCYEDWNLINLNVD